MLIRYHLDQLFVKFPNLTSPITSQPPLGKSDHALLQWTYKFAVPQPPPLPSKANPARINVQSLTSLALECNWEFPEKSFLNDLWISFRDQISLLISKATPPLKTRKQSLNKPYYVRRVKLSIQRRREAWTTWKNSSNASSAAAYLHLQQEQRRSRRILRAERLSYEWKLANSAKLAPKKCFAHVNRNKRMGTRIQRLLHPGG